MNTKPAIRFLAWFLLFVFSFQSTTQAASQASVNLLPSGPVWQSASIKISPSAAKIRSSYRGPSQKLVIQIQDAHTNFSAQINLASVLEELVTSYGLSTLFLEGSSGDVSLNHLRSHAPKAVREQVAKKYLASGEINGAEYLNLASDQHLNLEGVEDKVLYDKSLQAYAAVTSKREKVLASLEEIEKRLKILKGQFYPKEIFLLDESIREAQSGKRDFSDAYSYLTQAAERYSISPVYYPNFFTLKNLKVKESEIDFKKANQEFEDLLEELLFRSPGLSEVLGSVESPAKLKFRSDTMSHVYETLLETARRNGLDVGQYGEVVRFTEYLRIYASVDFEKLLNESKLLEEAVFDKALKEPKVRMIERFSRYLRYLKDLFSLRISNEDYDALQAMRSDPRFEMPAVLGAVNRALYDLGNTEDILIYRKTVEESFPAAETFYELTLDRDRKMVERLAQEIEKNNIPVSALLTGGYHTPHISSLLKERGISYVVVTPHVTHETNVKRYERLLLEQIPHEKKFRRLSSDQNGIHASELNLEAAATRNGGEVLGRIEADLASYAGEVPEKVLGARLASHWYSNNPYLMPRELFKRIEEYKKESQNRMRAIRTGFNRTDDDFERFLNTEYTKKFLETLEEDPFSAFLKAQKFFPASSENDRDRVLELLYWYRTYQILLKAEEQVLGYLAKYTKKYPKLKEIKKDDEKLDKETENLFLSAEDHEKLYEDLGNLHDVEIKYVNDHIRANGRIHSYVEKDLRFFDAHNIVIVTKKTIEDVLKSQKKALDKIEKSEKPKEGPQGPVKKGARLADAYQQTHLLVGDVMGSYLFNLKQKAVDLRDARTEENFEALAEVVEGIHRFIENFSPEGQSPFFWSKEWSMLAVANHPRFEKEFQSQERQTFDHKLLAEAGGFDFIYKTYKSPSTTLLWAIGQLSNDRQKRGAFADETFDMLLGAVVRMDRAYQEIQRSYEDRTREGGRPFVGVKGPEGARLAGIPEGTYQLEKLLPPVYVLGRRFYQRKVVEYYKQTNQYLLRLEWWLNKDEMGSYPSNRPGAMPDLLLYSASLAKDTVEQGIRGIRISDQLRGDSGLSRPLIEKFLEMISDPDGRAVTKTHLNTNNLILLDVLMKDFNFVAPEGTKPAGYAIGRKFYVKREYFQTTDLVTINSALVSTKNLIAVDDLDLFKNVSTKRPIYLGVSLERKTANLFARAAAGARLASDQKTEAVAQNIAMIYKDILERGIPDTDQRISTVYNTSPIYPHIHNIFPKAQLDRFRKRFPDLLNNIKKESNTFTKHVTLIYDFIRTLGPEGVSPPFYLSGEENRREIIQKVFTTKEFESILDPGRADEVGQIGRGGMTTATLFKFHGKSWDLSFAALTPNNIVEQIDAVRDRYESHKDPLLLKSEIIGILWGLGAFLAQGPTLQYLNPQGGPAFPFHLKSEGDRRVLVLIKKLLTRILDKPIGAVLDSAFFKDYAELQSLLETLSHDKKPRLIHQLFDQKSQKLSDVIREGRLSFSDKLRVMQSLSRSLQKIEAMGIVHRDIKPDNVLVRFDESGAMSETMLFDFGTATRIVEGPSGWERLKRKTIAWNDVTPEEINWLLNQTPKVYTAVDPYTLGYKPLDRGQKYYYSTQADIFALGVTFYEILTGAKPQGTRDAKEIANAQSQDMINRSIESTEAAPKKLKDLLGRMLNTKLENDIKSEKIVDVIDLAIAEGPRLKSPEALRSLIDKEIPKTLVEARSPELLASAKLKKVRETRQRILDTLLYLGDTPESREFMVYSTTASSNIVAYTYLSSKKAEFEVLFKNLESSETRRIAGARLAESPFEDDPIFMRFLAGLIWKAKGAPKNQPLEKEKADYEFAVELVQSGFPDNGSSVSDLAHTIWVAKGWPDQNKADELKDWLRAKRITEVLIPHYQKKRIALKEKKQVLEEKMALRRELAEKGRLMDKDLKKLAGMILEGYQSKDPITGEMAELEGLWVLLGKIRADMLHLTPGPVNKNFDDPKTAKELSEASRSRSEILASITSSMLPDRKGKNPNFKETIDTMPNKREVERLFIRTIRMGGVFADTDLMNKITPLAMYPATMFMYGNVSKEMLAKMWESYHKVEHILFLLKIYTASDQPTHLIVGETREEEAIDLKVSKEAFDLAIQNGIIPQPAKPTVKGIELPDLDAKPAVKAGARLSENLAPNFTEEALVIARAISREVVLGGTPVQVPIFAGVEGSAPLWSYSYTRVPGGSIEYRVAESDASTRFHGSHTLVSDGSIPRVEILNGHRVRPNVASSKVKALSAQGPSKTIFDIREEAAALSDASPLLQNVSYWRKQNLNLVNSWHKFLNEDLVKTPEGSVYVLSVPLATTFDSQNGWVLTPDFEESVRILVRELEAQDVKGDLLISFTAHSSSISEKAKNRIEASLQSVEKAFGRNKVRLTLSTLDQDKALIEGVLSGIDPKLKLSGISMGFDYKENGKNLDYDAERARQFKLRFFGIQMPKENEMISTLGLFIVGTLEVQSRFAIPLELLPYVQRTKSRKLGISIFVIRPHRISAELKRFFVNLRSTEISA